MFSSSFGRHSFEFRRVLTAARQQWTLNSDSELDFDGFVTVEFGENGHFAANLAPETMSIDFFFFLTGSSDVNSDSSDAHSASIAMSLTVFNSATFMPMLIPLKTLRNVSNLHLKIYSG